MKITKVLLTVAVLVTLNSLTPCTCKNLLVQKAKAKLDAFDKNMKRKNFKKKMIISSAILGVAILAHILAGIGYYNYKKKEHCHHEHNESCEECKVDEAAKNDAELNEDSTDKLKDIMFNMENKVERRNSDFDRYHISNMSVRWFQKPLSYN
ncbi:hypothetical protein AK88_03562 [Plasmodium fragile]|uniref:Early transcribed membrane protein n=1 Tax=Plasmodium fragile TaxID=5857 RepID=A0A0D9QIH1_PLAFR|nr:uncharacterized protein AK88_03562 [Plasmodium fragile]KJP86748.1 hypothetical protein AK88_03562 [Plasmodium fragile]